MKEDILEQVVDDWFLSQEGSFTKHNVKFKPNINHKDYIKKQDSSHSDIDILVINTNKVSNDRVAVVTCKSWQQGFNANKWADDLSNNPNNEFGGRESWKYFRELVIHKWAEAFVDAIKRETNSDEFTYYIACTKLTSGDKTNFEKNKVFINNLINGGARNPVIKIISFSDIFKDYYKRSDSQTLESTQVGRLLQLIKASNIKI